jgi:hypothetical protein
LNGRISDFAVAIVAVSLLGWAMIVWPLEGFFR